VSLLILKLNNKIYSKTAAVIVAWVKVDITLETASSLACVTSTAAEFVV